MSGNDPKLTNKQVLEKAIKRAIDAGWTFFDWTDDDSFTWEVVDDEMSHGGVVIETTGIDDFTWHPNLIIFDHDFAKALWGESWANFTEGQSGDSFSMQAQNWKGHLMNMVLAVKPINYLRKNI